MSAKALNIFGYCIPSKTAHSLCIVVTHQYPINIWCEWKINVGNMEFMKLVTSSLLQHKCIVRNVNQSFHKCIIKWKVVHVFNYQVHQQVGFHFIKELWLIVPCLLYVCLRQILYALYAGAVYFAGTDLLL